MLYIHQTTNPQYRILGAHRGPRPQRASVGVPGSVVFGLGRLLPGVGPLSSDPPRTPGRDDALHLPGGPGPGRAMPRRLLDGLLIHALLSLSFHPHPRTPRLRVILPAPRLHHRECCPLCRWVGQRLPDGSSGGAGWPSPPQGQLDHSRPMGLVEFLSGVGVEDGGAALHRRSSMPCRTPVVRSCLEQSRA